MNYILKIFTLIALSSFAGLTFANDTVAVVAPVAQKGDTAWMIMATILVILMSIPGLALFYGGMVRAKNMLSILMQVFVIFSLMAILWALYGYSIAFTEGNAFFG
ncbi:MAG: ammonia channel protein, partial [Methylococcales bacterium]